jgi:hypothetical protein
MTSSYCVQDHKGSYINTLNKRVCNGFIIQSNQLCDHARTHITFRMIPFIDLITHLRILFQSNSSLSIPTTAFLTLSLMDSLASADYPRDHLRSWKDFDVMHIRFGASGWNFAFAGLLPIFHDFGYHNYHHDHYRSHCNRNQGSSYS